MITEQKNIAIAEMLGWKYWKKIPWWNMWTKYSNAWEHPSKRFAVGSKGLAFDFDANWQFDAVEWIEKQGHEVTVQGHRNWVKGQRVYIGNYKNDIFVQTSSENKKDAIFESLYQFSQYLKKQNDKN